MKFLDGKALAGDIKERHSHRVKQLLASRIKPKLAIVQLKDDPVINTYVQLKKQYGADIGVAVEVHNSLQAKTPKLLDRLSNDKSVHGIIVQLPLSDPSETELIVNLVTPEKDVDALGKNSKYEPATPMAILWLLNGHNIDLAGKKILIIGRGRLVGAPLEKILNKSGLDVTIVDRTTNDLQGQSLEADVIIAAASSPGILKAGMIKPNAVIVDAGVASEDGKTLGNVAPEVYQREDITITPQKGGVGPLTVCALFENVIRAAQNNAQ